MTVSYWLGLNKIAEERWGSESGKSLAVSRPDSEAGTSAAGNGWYIYSGTGTMSYATDTHRGKVLRLQSSGASSHFLNGDFAYYGVNPNDVSYNDADRRHIGMWVKNNDGANAMTMDVLLDTSYYPVAELRLVSSSGTDGWAMGGSPSHPIYTHYLGTALNNSAWNYVEIEASDLVSAISGHTVDKVEGVGFLGKDIYVDDIIISGSELYRAYHQNPQSVLGGALGAQCGEDYPSVSQTQWWYHYNDLGTVLATTKADGTSLGIYAPDFYGNYRYTSGSRPDSMGLTGKFLDADAGLYYFNARWYDQERGRWISKEPLGLEGPNWYSFCRQDPTRHADPTGLLTGTAGGILLVPEDVIIHYRPTPKELCEAAGGTWASEADVKFGGDSNACVNSCMSARMYEASLGLATLGGLAGLCGTPAASVIGAGVAGSLPFVYCELKCNVPSCH